MLASGNHGERVILAAAFILLAGPPIAPAATVGGMVQVEHASILTDGSQHDRDVVIMLDRIGGDDGVMTDGRATIAQQGLVFTPHVLAVQKGSTVTFLNNDPAPLELGLLDVRTGRTLDVRAWESGARVDRRFAEAGAVGVLCQLRLGAAAYVVIADSPWFTSVQLDPGTQSAAFSIDNVPAGEYRLTVWHKTLRLRGSSLRLIVPQRGSVDAPVALTTVARATQGR
jgi:plastocyanin